MGKTVVLIGYSCSGKSEVGKAVKKACASRNISLDYRDSDEEIARMYGDGSIAGIFISQGRPKAMQIIETAEASFLDSFVYSSVARLVVTGDLSPR